MTALDERWFEPFKAINKSEADTEWINNFARVTAEEKIRFLQNDIENPVFTYSKIENNDLIAEEYLALDEQIRKKEGNEVIKNLYGKKIKNQLKRLNILTATRNLDDQTFFDLSCEVYGKPKKTYFSLVAKNVISLCDSEIKGPKSEAAKKLKKIFSKIDTSNSVLSDDILPPPVAEEGDPLTAKQVDQIFKETLDRYKITGWTTKIDETGDRTRFSVFVSGRIIYIPNDHHLLGRRKPLTRILALAIAEHEVGVHVRRAFEGEQQKLRLLSLGLAGYLRGEEGLASYVQQQIEGATEYYGFDRYLAICMAIGMDGAKRDFRSVYEIMYGYYYLTMPTETSHQLELVANAAWEVCVRIFRGTTGQSSGLVYTRDQVYFEGNVGIWKLLIDRPELFEQMFIGKFDPLSKSHVAALKNLDILPEW